MRGLAVKELAGRVARRVVARSRGDGPGVSDASGAAALSCAELRELDRLAIEELGIPSAVLMENAGRAAASCALELLRAAGTPRPSVLVLCGPGNNGGDGAVVARHLANAGERVELAYTHAFDALLGSAALQRSIVVRQGLRIVDAPEVNELEALLARHALRVDALLGTGSRGAPREPFASWIRALNAARASGGTTLALDLPSGLEADSGRAHDPTVVADRTVTFASTKLGFAAAARWTGAVEVASIGTPPKLAELARARVAASR